MRGLVIGKGEVGKSLYNILRKVHQTSIRDKDDIEIGEVDILHICFPYFKEFINEVKCYIDCYQPRYTVIHSTVPVGTSVLCEAYHSPIRGMHPKMEKGIKTFVKYLAPKNNELKRYFEKAGIKIKLVNRQENTEALKIFDTTQYGVCIRMEKEIHKFCKENDLDFGIVYTDANNTYNDGYISLGLRNVTRPVLKHYPGEIGGHCILNNCNLLKNSLTNFVKKEICES
jgi:hypothetical protein